MRFWVYQEKTKNPQPFPVEDFNKNGVYLKLKHIFHIPVFHREGEDVDVFAKFTTAKQCSGEGSDAVPCDGNILEDTLLHG